MVESMTVEKKGRSLRAGGENERIEWAVGIPGKGNDMSSYLSNIPCINEGLNSKSQEPNSNQLKGKRGGWGFTGKIAAETQAWRHRAKPEMGTWPPECLPLFLWHVPFRKALSTQELGQLLEGPTSQSQNLWSKEKRVNLLSNLGKSGERFWRWGYLSLGYTSTTVDMGIRDYGIPWEPHELRQK